MRFRADLETKNVERSPSRRHPRLQLLEPVLDEFDEHGFRFSASDQKIVAVGMHGEDLGVPGEDRRFVLGYSDPTISECEYRA